MTIKYHENVIQGSVEWFALRCGILTASEMKNIINAEFEAVKTTKKDKDRGKDITHIYELLSQRISNYIEPSYMRFFLQNCGKFTFGTMSLVLNHFVPIKLHFKGY